MPQMTSAQARVIDPVLTTVARGYKNPEFVGNLLFPAVPVGARGGKIVSFGKEAFRQYNTGRSPGSNTKRISLGYSGASFALESHSLEAVVPVEWSQEASAVPGIDLSSGSVFTVQNIIAARLEAAQATLATTAANYAASNKTTLSGTSQWSDYTGVSQPVKDVEAAKEAVRAQIGRRPNVLVLGALVFAALRNHPVIIDRIKYTGRDTVTTELLAGLFGVAQVVIGDAVTENESGVLSDIWGKYAILAYTELGGIANQGLPTFGYTYRLNGYPMVEQAYYEPNAKSWIYPVSDEVVPVIAGAEAGFLFSAAVA